MTNVATFIGYLFWFVVAIATLQVLKRKQYKNEDRSKQVSEDPSKRQEVFTRCNDQQR